MSETLNNKYYAFISYSHRDDEWGAWLHKGLESYRPPKALIGKTNRDGKVPKKLTPIFQDIHELPTASDLGSMIKSALEQSRYLIVICSPASAQSIWVNEEILTYKRLGKADRILAIIVDGEPNASSISGQEHLECFPPALRYQLDDAGNLSDQAAEPIAADARKGKGGEKNALLKLVAGLLGVNFDDLAQREKQRAKKRRFVLAGIAGSLLLGSLFIWNNFQQEQQKTKQAQIDQLTSEAVTALENGNVDVAMNKLSTALPENITDTASARFQRSFAVLNRANFMQKERSQQTVTHLLLGIKILNNGSLLAQNKRGDVQIFDAEGVLRKEFKGVIFEGKQLYDTNYYLNKTQNLLTLSSVVNKAVTQQDGSNLYLDFFRSKIYDINTGELLYELEKQLDITLYGNISRYVGEYMNNGRHYLIQFSEYSDQSSHRTYLIKIDTRTGEHESWLTTEADIISYQYIDDVGVIVKTETGDETGGYVFGLSIARPDDRQFTTLLPSDNINLCNAGESVHRADLKDLNDSYNIRSPYYGVTPDKSTLILLSSDISGYSGYCMRSWDISTLIASKIISLRDFKSLKASDREMASKLVNLEPALYRFNKYGQLQSLMDVDVALLSDDKKTFIKANKDNPEINVELKIGEKYTLKGHKGGIVALALNNKTGVLYSAAEDMTLRLWNVEPTVNIGSTGFNYIKAIQMSGNRLLAEESTWGENETELFTYALFPIFSESGKIDFTNQITIKVSAAKEKQLEGRLLMQGSRLGVVMNKKSFRRVYRKKQSAPPPLVKSIFKLFDSHTGTLLTTVEHDLIIFDYPAILGQTAYFPADSELLSVNLKDGSSKRVGLEDGFSIKRVILHGDSLLLLADNNENQDPYKRIYRLYMLNPATNSGPRLLTERKSQSAWFVTQDTHMRRTLVEWDNDNRSLIEADGRVRKITSAQKIGSSPDFILSSNKDIIYRAESGKFIQSTNFDGTSIDSTFSTLSWYRPSLFRNEQYVIDGDSILGLSDDVDCKKISSLVGLINRSENGKFLRVGSVIYDLDVCEVIKELTVDVSRDALLLSNDGVLIYAYRGDIIQVPVKRTVTDNFEHLERWRAQQRLSLE